VSPCRAPSVAALVIASHPTGSLAPLWWADLLAVWAFVVAAGLLGRLGLEEDAGRARR
jgi:hypothetical protein